MNVTESPVPKIPHKSLCELQVLFIFQFDVKRHPQRSDHALTFSNVLSIFVGAGNDEGRSRDEVVPDGIEPAGLHARVRAVHAMQEGDGELQVLDRVVPGGLSVHVQGQVLPRPFPLINAPRDRDIIVSGPFNSFRLAFDLRICLFM